MESVIYYEAEHYKRYHTMIERTYTEYDCYYKLTCVNSHTFMNTYRDDAILYPLFINCEKDK